MQLGRDERREKAAERTRCLAERERVGRGGGRDDIG